MGRAMWLTVTAFKSRSRLRAYVQGRLDRGHRVCVGKVHRQGEGIADVAAVSTHPRWL